MAIFNAQNQSPAAIISGIQAKLVAHRRALEDLADVYKWSSGIAAADLQAAPFNMSAADAGTLLAAVADANAEYQLHLTGLPPATYPQPPAAYVYGASQTQVIGPLA